jgi:site-specific DNA-methyltransferase (adenine-specific)
VLDPFAGAGTTGLVSMRHGRSFLGLELSPGYADLARRRIREDSPMFNEHAEIRPGL